MNMKPFAQPSTVQLTELLSKQNPSPPPPSSSSSSSSSPSSPSSSSSSSLMWNIAGVIATSAIAYLGYHLLTSKPSSSSSPTSSKKKSSEGLRGLPSPSPTSSTTTTTTSSSSSSTTTPSPTTTTTTSASSPGYSLGISPGDVTRIGDGEISTALLNENNGAVLMASAERAVKLAVYDDFDFDSVLFKKVMSTDVRELHLETRLKAAEWLVAAETKHTQVYCAKAIKKREKANVDDGSGVGNGKKEKNESEEEEEEDDDDGDDDNDGEAQKTEIDFQLPFLALLHKKKHVAALMKAWEYLDGILPTSVDSRRTRHCLRLSIGWKLQNIHMMNLSYDVMNGLSNKSMVEVMYCFIASTHLGRWKDIASHGDELMSFKLELPDDVRELQQKQHKSETGELMNILYHCSWQMPPSCHYPNYAAVYQIVKQLLSSPEGVALLHSSGPIRQVAADFSVNSFVLKFDKVNSENRKYKLQQTKEYPKTPQSITVPESIHRVGFVVVWVGVINAIPISGLFIADNIYFLGHVNTQEGENIVQVDEEFVLRRGAEVSRPHVWHGFVQWKKSKVSGPSHVTEHETIFTVEMVMKCLTRKAIEEEVELHTNSAKTVTAAAEATTNSNNSIKSVDSFATAEEAEEDDVAVVSHASASKKKKSKSKKK